MKDLGRVVGHGPEAHVVYDRQPIRRPHRSVGYRIGYALAFVVALAVVWALLIALGLGVYGLGRAVGAW